MVVHERACFMPRTWERLLEVAAPVRAESGCLESHRIIGSVRTGKQVRPYVWALTLKLGRPIAPGKETCHTCDNPLCMEPEHLWEGTRAENLQDMMRKGRGRGQFRTRRH